MFELGNQEPAGEYTIDESVSNTVTFAANTRACSQQDRRTTVAHNLLFISEIEGEKMSWIS